MRNNTHIIYTSSYDRGLEHLLAMWPDIKKVVPSAVLHICYGWQLFEKFHKDNPSSMMWLEKQKKMMEHEGIVHHGRLTQEEVAELMSTCGIWAYPTHFGEINCISGIKAQAYGCEPVVINYAALTQTVQYGRKVEGDIYDQETKDEFKKQLIDALENPMSSDKRKKMMKWAKDTYSWESIITNWNKEFKS